MPHTNNKRSHDHDRTALPNDQLVCYRRMGWCTTLQLPRRMQAGLTDALRFRRRRHTVHISPSGGRTGNMSDTTRLEFENNMYQVCASI